MFDCALGAFGTLKPEVKKWWDEAGQTEAKGKKRAGSPSYSEAAKQQPAAKAQRTASGGAGPSRLAKMGLPTVPGKTAQEVKAIADANPAACVGCGRTGHRYAQCPSKGLDTLTLPHACLAEVASYVDDKAQHCNALPALIAESDPLQTSVMPAHVWRRCAKLTKQFDLLVGCNAADIDQTCMTPDEFCSSLHEGHAFINASQCSPFEAKQLILHAQLCRKRKAFSAVYLLPSGKDAVWKSLLADVSHIARLRLTSSMRVHAYYQRIFVPDLSSWPCQIAGQAPLRLRLRLRL